jgi:hypothetical protein
MFIFLMIIMHLLSTSNATMDSRVHFNECRLSALPRAGSSFLKSLFVVHSLMLQGMHIEDLYAADDDHISIIPSYLQRRAQLPISLPMFSHNPEATSKLQLVYVVRPYKETFESWMAYNIKNVELLYNRNKTNAIMTFAGALVSHLNAASAGETAPFVVTVDYLSMNCDGVFAEMLRRCSNSHFDEKEHSVSLFEVCVYVQTNPDLTNLTMPQQMRNRRHYHELVTQEQDDLLRDYIWNHLSHPVFWQEYIELDR